MIERVGAGVTLTYALQTYLYKQQITRQMENIVFRVRSLSTELKYLVLFMSTNTSMTLSFHHYTTPDCERELFVHE